LLTLHSQRAWHCEGALAVQRAVSRGTSLKLEMWLQHARQLSAQVRLDAVGAALSASLAASPCSMRPFPRKRRRVLQALFDALERMKATRGAACVLDATLFHTVLQEVLPPNLQETEAVSALSIPSAVPTLPDVERRAHIQNSRFNHRAYNAALAVAKCLEVDDTSFKLADQLQSDVDQSLEQLECATQETSFLERTRNVWQSLVLECLRDVEGSTVEEAFASVRKELCALQMVLCGAGLEVVHQRPDAIPIETQPALPLHTDIPHEWCGAPSRRGVHISRHAQLARAVGTLWGLELARETAGLEVNATTFAMKKRCVQLRVEARMLEMVAEKSMTDTARSVMSTHSDRASLQHLQSPRSDKREEETPKTPLASKPNAPEGAQSAAEGRTSVTPDGPSKTGNKHVRKLVAAVRMATTFSSAAQGAAAARAKAAAEMAAQQEAAERREEQLFAQGEALVDECFRVDSNLLLTAWQKDAFSHEDGSGMVESLLTGLSKLKSRTSAKEPSVPPTIPPMSAWWRGTEDPFDLSWPPCERCLSVSRLLFDSPELRKADPKGQMLARHASALRIWLFARAQRAVVRAVLRESSLEEVALVQHHRTYARMLELAMRDALRERHMVELLDARGVVLDTATSFLAPLDARCAEVLDGRFVAAHLAEVHDSFDRGLHRDIDGLLSERASALDEFSIEQGALASATACQSVGVKVNEAHLKRASVCSRKPFADYLDQVDSDRADRDRQILQLCGTLRGLELLRTACAGVAAPLARDIGE